MNKLNIKIDNLKLNQNKSHSNIETNLKKIENIRNKINNFNKD